MLLLRALSVVVCVCVYVCVCVCVCVHACVCDRGGGGWQKCAVDISVFLMLLHGWCQRKNLHFNLSSNLRKTHL